MNWGHLRSNGFFICYAKSRIRKLSLKEIAPVPRHLVQTSRGLSSISTILWPSRARLGIVGDFLQWNKRRGCASLLPRPLSRKPPRLHEARFYRNDYFEPVARVQVYGCSIKFHSTRSLSVYLSPITILLRRDEVKDGNWQVAALSLLSLFSFPCPPFHYEDEWGGESSEQCISAATTLSSVDAFGGATTWATASTVRCRKIIPPARRTSLTVPTTSAMSWRAAIGAYARRIASLNVSGIARIASSIG